MMFLQHVGLGAAIGFVTAMGVDLHAYSDSPDGTKFNWSKAVARWICGAIGGATLAIGGSAAGAK